MNRIKEEVPPVSTGIYLGKNVNMANRKSPSPWVQWDCWTRSVDGGESVIPTLLLHRWDWIWDVKGQRESVLPQEFSGEISQVV